MGGKSTWSLRVPVFLDMRAVRACGRVFSQCWYSKGSASSLLKTLEAARYMVSFEYWDHSHGSYSLGLCICMRSIAPRAD